jgi:hypothetical protein
MTPVREFFSSSADRRECDDVAYPLRRFGWQELQKGAALAAADAIGYGPRELGGNRPIAVIRRSAGP